MPQEGVAIQWQVRPEELELADVEVEVRRSGSPVGPMETLGVIDPLTTYLFYDTTAPWRPDEIGLYYQLAAVWKSSGATAALGSVFNDQNPLPKYALEILRQTRIQYQGVNGHSGFVARECTIYKKRNFGSRCRECTDPVTRRVTISGCRVCGGTGYSGGYYNPVNVYCQIDPEQRRLDFTPINKYDDRQTSVRLMNVPILYPGDIVVEQSEKHWRVVSVDPTEDNRRNLITQSVGAVEIDRNDVVYRTMRHSKNGGFKP